MPLPLLLLVVLLLAPPPLGRCEGGEGSGSCGCGLSRGEGAGEGGKGCGAGERAGGRVLLAAPAPREDLEMATLQGGAFTLGSEEAPSHQYLVDGEHPARAATVGPFKIDVAEISNRAFAEFVNATGHVTDAEVFGWSFVFEPFLPEDVDAEATQAVAGSEWWVMVGGTSWAQPEGPSSTWKGRGDYAATHLSWRDVDAYCRWRGKRLPTDAEWEFAARGGLHQKRYPWGDGDEDLHLRANTFEGDSFPDDAYSPPPDGYHGPAPVRSYRPNGYGLYNAVGNVWEWTADEAPAPPGERAGAPGEPRAAHHWQRGGSFMCHKSYCDRYRTSAKVVSTADSSSQNTGGRCAMTTSKVRDFTEKYGLGSPVGVQLFQADWDDVVPAIHKQIGFA